MPDEDPLRARSLPLPPTYVLLWARSPATRAAPTVIVMTASSGAAASVAVRPAESDDVDVLHRFIMELAAAEQFPGEVTVVSRAY